MTIKTYLIEKIKSEGPLPLDVFMGDVLYHPDFGYYTSKIPIGREGDYITAPEMTQVFAELLVLWFIDVWQKFGCPSPVNIVELGGGKGTLMDDFLRTLSKIPFFTPSYSAHVVDISPALISLQKKKLAKYPHVFWHKDLKTVSKGFTFFIANEFFDALPIKQYVFLNQQWYERLVSYEEGEFVFIPGNEGSILERHTSYISWVHEISDRLSEEGGAALIIDYGYYQEGAIGDTLQALHQHKYVSIFDNLGKADLTHHVNFTFLKELFQDKGGAVHGPQYQGIFLKNMGIVERTEQICLKAAADQASLLRTAVVRLTNPVHMGNLFKVLSVTSDARIQPLGVTNG